MRRKDGRDDTNIAKELTSARGHIIDNPKASVIPDAPARTIVSVHPIQPHLAALLDAVIHLNRRWYWLASVLLIGGAVLVTSTLAGVGPVLPISIVGTTTASGLTLRHSPAELGLAALVTCRVKPTQVLHVRRVIIVAEARVGVRAMIGIAKISGA